MNLIAELSIISEALQQTVNDLESDLEKACGKEMRSSTW